ncbi:GNAT family N-acetyltransferase [Bacillus infantis]|uniref:GNAT family N-acetyltransferase n=1 Tax=Bacillus infantis TaxID=324767 RepID=UPI003CEF38A3
METMIRCAQKEDENKLAAFLEKANLGTEGIADSINYFLLMEDEELNIKATLGIEPLGSVGLLRSLVLSEKASEKDLLLLVEQILRLARERELESLYMATNKKGAAEFFKLLGFQDEKSELPEELYRSSHVQHILTVDNFTFLKLPI